MLGPAWPRISDRGRKSFDDSLQVGHALAIGRTEALRAAGTNSPVGSKFNKAIGTWLAANGLDGVTAPQNRRPQAPHQRNRRMEQQRNATGARIKWMFTTDKARAKMGRAYPATPKES